MLDLDLDLDLADRPILVPPLHEAAPEQASCSAADVAIVVHRSATEIGGNCIELCAGGVRLLLDLGRPLRAAGPSTGGLPATLDTASPMAAVLVSHPHLDHYGLLHEAPSHWPVHCGEAAAALMRLTSAITRQPLRQPFVTWRNGRRFDIGPFAITPWLTDHSAFDACMLLIEVHGRRIVYTGDFRRHGRKAALVDRLMRRPPPDIDVLLLEGTNLQSAKSTVSEAAIEDGFADLFRQTPGRVFVTWSAQNIDRTVSLYRACLRTGRTLAIDLYTAEVLETLAASGRIPRPGWRNLKVVVTRSLARRYRLSGRGAFIERMLPNAVPARALAVSSDWVVTTRKSLLRDFEHSGVRPGADDAWSFSMWLGGLAEPDGQRLHDWFESGGARRRHLHTSGHASHVDLEAFARALNAKRILPIHGERWRTGMAGFERLTTVADGERVLLSGIP